MVMDASFNSGVWPYWPSASCQTWTSHCKRCHDQGVKSLLSCSWEQAKAPGSDRGMQAPSACCSSMCLLRLEECPRGTPTAGWQERCSQRLREELQRQPALGAHEMTREVQRSGGAMAANSICRRCLAGEALLVTSHGKSLRLAQTTCHCILLLLSNLVCQTAGES